MFSKIVVSLISCSILIYACENEGLDDSHFPTLKMKETNLSFKEISDYQNYKIVATHFRKDKNELRYILANQIAFKALKNETKIMPEGSKVVKIGWSTKDMSTFSSAVEADKIQRVEYMIKDKTKHHESDGWGYARFVKNNGVYKSWEGDIQSCVSCHAIVKSNDALFTKYQQMF